MSPYLAEVDANFEKFTLRWKEEVGRVSTELDANREVFLRSYCRLTSLNAWRDSLLEGLISSESLAFYIEAQNDALVSHVLARLGSWRSALKSLRSCIENVAATIYYKDHPVELEQWELGRQRLGFEALHKYLQTYPLIENLPPSVTGLQTLKQEYSVLSRAVHASAKSFRMTGEGEPTLLWSSHKKSLGAWSTREAQAVSAVNLLLLSVFRDHLQGAGHRGLRIAVGFAVPSSQHRSIKGILHVTLPSP